MEKENPFKKLGKPAKEVPKGLKQKVISSIKSTEMLKNVVKDTDEMENICFNLFNKIEDNSSEKE
ncbi:hypothetical protein [Aquimarina sp. SS2-1]|uniref:hypothetical protein n=1 Tax=Aquimarina besae TaxID=3342247 RepID=UPI00366EEC65